MDHSMPMHMSDMPMDGTTMAPMKKMHMWMWFHTKVDDTVLFKGWNVTSAGEMVWTCAIIFVVGILYEALKWLRWRLEVLYEHSPSTSPATTNYRQRLFSSSHLLQTILFGVQIVISYVLMLVFMTFSVWLGLAVTLGAAVGYYFFGSRKLENSGQGSAGDASAWHS